MVKVVYEVKSDFEADLDKESCPSANPLGPLVYNTPNSTFLSSKGAPAGTRAA